MNKPYSPAFATHQDAEEWRLRTERAAQQGNQAVPTASEFSSPSSGSLPNTSGPAVAARPQDGEVPSYSLHIETGRLINRFATAIKEKLAAAEQKYGYSDGWADDGWMDECRAKLLEHVGKGDPRDVAAYCAFLWHHGESTAAPQGAPREAQAVAWRREWDGDVSDEGHMLYEDDESQLDEPRSRWQPLYALPSPSGQWVSVPRERLECYRSWFADLSEFGMDARYTGTDDPTPNSEYTAAIAKEIAAMLAALPASPEGRK